MGIQDRDWYHEHHRKRERAADAQRASLTVAQRRPDLPSTLGGWINHILKGLLMVYGAFHLIADIARWLSRHHF